MARKALTITALIAGVGAVATEIASSRQSAAAEAAYPPIGQFVDVTGGRVHYVQEGSGPHVILLHGAGGNLREFTFDLMDRLSDRYTVTAFDRPGLGYTDRVPGVDTGAFATEGDPPLAQAAMLREAAAQIGIEDPVVVGHSFGGIVAIAWALQGLDTQSSQDAAAIVSLAGVAMPWPGDLGWYYVYNGSALGGAVLVPLLSAFVPQDRVDSAIVETFAPQQPPAGYAEYIGAPLTIRADSFRANVRQVNTLRPHVVEMAKRYPDLTLPIEILHGSADTTVPPHVHSKEIIKIVPSANLTMLDGIGHMPHQNDPEAAVAAIDRAAVRAGLR
ncbi:alpha/beta fold hydrolase [Yoonia sp. R2331]|uniref:alpha/beta fold hydrolase n=1 Tax=Yoonia sp. R2331 TaxID=3237238 RepID=UPI0034E5A425